MSATCCPSRLRPLSLAIATLLVPAAPHAAVVDWLPDADGFWDVVTNWSSNPALPGAGDDVLIDVGGATVRTVTHRSGTNSVTSLTSEENFALTGGTLSLASASLVNGGYTQSAGTLAGIGTLTVSGTASLSGGSMVRSGRTVLQGDTTISNSFNLDTGRVFENQGVLAWPAGVFELNANSDPGAGRVENAVGATFASTATGNTSLRSTNRSAADNGQDGRFDNAGTFRKSTGLGTTTISVAFNNTGTVEVESGTLTLSGGGNHTGAFTVADGATLNLAGGTHDFDASASLTGADFTFGSATINMNGTYDVRSTMRDRIISSPTEAKS